MALPGSSRITLVPGEESLRFEFAAERERERERSVLRAVFEDGDHYEGVRQEGSGQTITYSGEDITFDYKPESIHPDLLGLLCLIIFYPFIGRRALFPQPVSPRLEEAFQNPCFDNKFRFDNVDDSLERYAGSRIALSFGGGIDSSALRVMFPEAFVVHEAHLKEGVFLPSLAHSVVGQLGPERGRVVTSNQRYVSHPGGWHGWPCSAATTLLMAADQDFGIILMGSQLCSSLLASGSHYWDRFRARAWHGFTGNYWQSAFNAVGLPMFSPLCGASEYAAMTLSLDLIREGKVVYCMERDGGACFRCAKCLRRDVIRAVVEPEYSPDWRAYDRPDIYRFLERRPLYFGHNFSYAMGRVDGLPRFFTSRMRGVPAIRSDWPLRCHTGTFEFCDPAWRERISGPVLERLRPMTEEQIAELESWDGRPPPDAADPRRGARFLTRMRDRLRN